MEVTRTQRSWAWPIAWTVVYALNLIVPYDIGVAAMELKDTQSILACTVFLWILGIAACVGYPPLGRRLVRGGLIVAITQFVPILQIMAGAFADLLVKPQNLPYSEFFITIAMGGSLMLISLVPEFFCTSIWRWIVLFTNLTPQPKHKSQRDEEIWSME
ncbi:hypothetical protein [Singulisphaera sp. PoT]|uniref:hypothetical protein n=1 Tax=Singulisphaera sp. PoT TaxID=3411797 RepID=UPI003BF59027